MNAPLAAVDAEAESDHEEVAMAVPRLDVADERGDAAQDPGMPENEMQQQRQERARSWRTARTFMQSHWFPNFWVLRAALQPEIDLMNTILSEASYKHEVNQMYSLLTSGTRRSHITNVLSRRHIERMFIAARNTFLTAALWNVLAPTEVQRSNIFRHCVHAAGVIFQHVCCKYERFPWLLFRILFDGTEETAAHILQKPVSLRDEFASGFLERYCEPALLLSPEAHETLSACAALVQTNTYSTERMHSCNSRKLAQRVLAKACSLEDMMCQHMTAPGPGFIQEAWLQKRREQTAGGGRKRRGRPTKESRKSLKRQQQGCQDQAEKPKRKGGGGGGGSWRAYQHYQNIGKLDAEGVRAMRDRYHALSPEEKAWYAEAGRLGLSVGSKSKLCGRGLRRKH